MVFHCIVFTFNQINILKLTKIIGALQEFSDILYTWHSIKQIHKGIMSCESNVN